MSATFARAARHLAGAAGLLLGWRPNEFWRATPAELAAVLGLLAGEAAVSATGDDLRRLMEMFPDG
ncbi:phage tail assembly chaperone [Sphingosinicella humi]|uniref:Phage tail assembly chaperone n=1 Tax=Allosphingosinicella humi TaxID=2068657 RepID=A0A2U2J0H9_9SPHN|nr:phage tail assembly chaperone [Sphingosinicella humi]PWG01833.1 phage tail assembly chaperone [Sphingosinicella humi]